MTYIYIIAVADLLFNETVPRANSGLLNTSPTTLRIHIITKCLKGAARRMCLKVAI